jgi:hypothetical protein
MPEPRDPLKLPEWHAISREVALVRQLIGSGVTSLGRANYADKLGEYYTAFFGLSVGFERLSKLILVADHVMANAGEMPKEKAVRKFGHHLVKLTDEVKKVSLRHSLKPGYGFPSNPISVKILECLDAFADANRGRYANFAALGDPDIREEEPVRKWWASVAELILQDHYHGKAVQRRVESRAEIVHRLMGNDAMVLHTGECGSHLRDLFSASVRTGQGELVQRYGRYYALVLARWLSSVFNEIARVATYTHECDAFSGAWEPLQTYTVDSYFLRTRKIWPLY